MRSFEQLSMFALADNLGAYLRISYRRGESKVTLKVADKEIEDTFSVRDTFVDDR